MGKCVLIVIAVALGGCSTSIMDSHGEGPDWFETRRASVTEDGYPSLQIVQKLDVEGGIAPWSQISRNLRTAQIDMRREEPGPIRINAAQMRRWAAEQRAIVAKGEEPY